MVSTHCPAVGVPVIVPCDPRELSPLVAWLSRREAPATTIAFPRGTVLADGRLDLCKQAIGPDGARVVLDALRGHPAIRTILFGTGAIGNAGASAVAGALAEGLPLETVYLGCNRIDHVGAAALAGALDASSVRALWLKRNPLGVAGARAIADAPHLSHLSVLDLFNCELDDEGVASVARALANPAVRVEHVYLGGNAAGWCAARAVAELLAETRTLRTLDLSASRLGDDGAETLAAGLAANASLEGLALANNAIGSRGAAALGAAIARHPRVAALGLGTVTAARALGEPTNHIGDAGAFAMADLIATTTTLRSLDLHGNGITSHGAFAIARALAQSSTLVELGLHRDVAKTIRRRIRQRLAANAVPLAVPPHVMAIRSVYRGL